MPGAAALALCIALTLALCGLAPRSARADPVFGTSTAAEEQGFRLGGTLQLHVFSNVDLRFDSNPALQIDRLAVSDLVLRVRLGANLRQPSEKLELNSTLSLDWSQFFGLTNASTRQLSALQGTGEVTVTANKSGKISLFGSEALTRLDGPTQNSIAERLSSFRNAVRVGATFRPGGGALELQTSYGFDYLWYDKTQTPTFTDPVALGTYAHVFHAQGLWRFLPRTALSLEVDQFITRYPNSSAQVPSVDSNPLRARLGLLGQITEKLSGRVALGYVNTFVSGDAAAASSNYQGIFIATQLGFRASELLNFTLGYTRDVAATPLYGWIASDRVFAEYQHLIFARWAATGRLSYESQNFGKAVLATLGPRHDSVIRAEARLTYQPKSWLGTSAYYLPEWRITNFSDSSGSAGSYSRQVIGMDVTFGY